MTVSKKVDDLPDVVKLLQFGTDEVLSTEEEVMRQCSVVVYIALFSARGGKRGGGPPGD